MTRVNKGRKQPIPKLVCVKAKAGAGCEYKPISSVLIEEGLKIQFRLKKTDRKAPSYHSPLNADIEKEEAEYKAISEQIDSMLKNPELMKYDDAQKTVADLLARKQELASSSELHLAVIKLVEDGFYNERHNELHDLLQAKQLDRQAINVVLRQMYTKAVIDQDEQEIALQTRFGVALVVELKLVDMDDRRNAHTHRDDRGRFIRM